MAAEEFRGKLVRIEDDLAIDEKTGKLNFLAEDDKQLAEEIEKLETHFAERHRNQLMFAAFCVKRGLESDVAEADIPQEIIAAFEHD